MKKVINKTYGILGLCAKAGMLVAGSDICEEYIKKGKLKLLLVASDASERTKNNFKFLCNNNSVDYIEMGNIEEISKSIGKSNKALVGIKDSNFAKKIKDLKVGGEC